MVIGGLGVVEAYPVEGGGLGLAAALPGKVLADTIYPFYGKNTAIQKIGT
jgi:hypothetical protein